MPSLRPTRTALIALVALLAPLALAGPAAASSTANEVVHVVLDDTGGRLVITDLASRRSTTVLSMTDSQLFTEPELSPDGDTIAFVLAEFSETAITFGVAAVERDGSGLRQLTTPAPDTQLDLSPRWSPDGGRLMFTRVTLPPDETGDATGSLLTVPPTGGEPTELVAGAVGGDWAPDGATVVVLEGPIAPDAVDASLARVDLSSGVRSPLGVRGFSPTWSPDGATVAYVSVVDPELGSTQLATVPATGGPARLLTATAPAEDGIAESPSWSPDSASLLYTALTGGEEGDVALWAVDSDGGRAGRLLPRDPDTVTLAGSIQGPAPSAVAGRSPAAFTAVVPQRLLDTREDGSVRVGPGVTVDVPVVGVETSRGAVPADATAVVLNVTVTGGTASTDVRAYPAGAPVPLVSNLNAARSTTVPNLVTVPLGEGGAVTLRNNSGSVHLIADLAGWYAPQAGDGFAPVGPARLLDTRDGSQPLGPGGVRDLQVTGELQKTDGGTVTVPADASAVVLNVTGTGGTAAATDVRAYPRPLGAAVPQSSNLNLSRGQTAAGLVVVAVGEGGQVRLRNNAGQLHLLADVVGYYAPSAPGRFVAAEPVRLLDTRDATGAAPLPLLAGTTVDLRVGGARGIPAGATAAVVNLTATSVSASTDVRSYPTTAGGTVPTVSTLNVTRGTTRANAAVVRTGDGGRVRLRNNSGSVHLIADLAGWFQPAA